MTHYLQHFISRLFLAACFASVPLLVGCSAERDSVVAIHDYHQRMMRLLDADFQPAVFTERYPTRRALQLKEPAITITLTEFLGFTRCSDLHLLIGERNSQLGKQMEPATRLLYELKLRLAIENCLVNYPNEKKLLAIQRDIDERYATVVWNTTWGSRYWQTLFSAAQQDKQYQVEDFRRVFYLLSTIRDIVWWKAPLDEKAWYQTYQELERYPGILYHIVEESYLQSESMKDINEILEKKQSWICPQKRKTEKSAYLVNVLNKFYFQSVQKRQQTIRIAEDLWVEFESDWHSLFKSAPSGFNDWYSTSAESMHNRLAKQIAEHVRIWQQLGESCTQPIVPLRN